MFLAAGAFAVQNPDSAQFHFLSYVWELPQWVPALAGVSVMAVLLVLHMTFATIGGQLQRFGHHRELGGHQDAISELEARNAKLREELAAARGAASATRAAASAPAAPAGSAAHAAGTPGWRSWLRAPGSAASKRSPEG